MSHYASQIPLPLAEKLKEKGMPEIEIVWNPIRGKHYCFKTYAEVFDWLIEKGINAEVYLSMTRLDNTGIPTEQVYAYNVFSRQGKPIGEEDNNMNWHEAAYAAIKKALTLI